MVAPVAIEEKIKSSSLISQVCMVGDGRKYFTALFTLTPQALAKVKQQDGFVVSDQQLLEQLQRAVNAANEELACYEQIKYFTALVNDFTVDTGELTPTLKLRRSEIEHRYRNIIENMYSTEKEMKVLATHRCPLLCSPETCICSKHKTCRKASDV